MRLINTSTYILHDVQELGRPQYAILSHRWEGAEVTFRMLDSAKWRASNLHNPQMKKIKDACAKARLRNPPLEWLWVDTCCIDKTNSVELASSLNSMFEWYYKATVCYAYLYDVEWNARNKEISKSQDPKRLGQESAWFERGWTLQELLAPRNMEFYDQKWDFMGTKDSLANILQCKTGIATKYLTGASNFKQASVATRMSWMAGRTTTEIEDIAYSMLGLLNINMEIHYGEGVKAFMRLQRILMESSIDESIFAWTIPDQGLTCYKEHFPQASQWAPKDWGLLAPSPDCFAKYSDLFVLPDLYVPRLSGGYKWTQQGVQFQMPMVAGTEVTNIFGVARNEVTLALNCWTNGTDGKRYNINVQLLKTGNVYKRVQCNELGKKKGSKPKTNSRFGIDQVLTRPLTITQPEFDTFV